MRAFWTFISGAALGDLAVTSVFVMEGDEKSDYISEDEFELEEEIDEDGTVTGRIS